MGSLNLISDTASHAFIITIEVEESLSTALNLAVVAHEFFHLIGQSALDHGFQPIDEMLNLISGQFFQNAVDSDQIFSRKACLRPESLNVLQRIGIEGCQFFRIEKFVNFDAGALGNFETAMTSPVFSVSPAAGPAPI